MLVVRLAPRHWREDRRDGRQSSGSARRFRAIHGFPQRRRRRTILSASPLPPYHPRDGSEAFRISQTSLPSPPDWGRWVGGPSFPTSRRTSSTHGHRDRPGKTLLEATSHPSKGGACFAAMGGAPLDSCSAVVTLTLVDPREPVGFDLELESPPRTAPGPCWAETSGTSPDFPAIRCRIRACARVLCLQASALLAHRHPLGLPPRRTSRCIGYCFRQMCSCADPTRLTASTLCTSRPAALPAESRRLCSSDQLPSALRARYCQTTIAIGRSAVSRAIALLEVAGGTRTCRPLLGRTRTEGVAAVAWGCLVAGRLAHRLGDGHVQWTSVAMSLGRSLVSNG
eukprot:scaffold1642_cov252-Pinguiococcus_pyrenoidosus.AAC.6